MLLLIIIGYVLCCVVSYAGTFAYFQRKYKNIAEEQYHADMDLSVCVSLFGPVSLIISFFMSGGFKLGFKFK